jgi:glycosyltransferase involved in cell wall biosynthesis
LYTHIRNLGKKAVLVQNGVTPEEFDLSKKIFKRIVFVGALTYKENINAIKVIAQLSKMLKKSNIDYEILIIGGPRIILKKILSENKNIKFLEFIEENYYKEVLKSAYIGLLPFFHKEELGGQRIKALEYLSHGILTVSSFEGVRGIQGLKADEHYINVSCIDELCDKIKKILKEPIEYLNVAKKGHEFVINNYAWSKVTVPYIELIKSLCEEL